MEERFKIRDARAKGWYWMSHEYLNGYAKLCGIFATGVYTSLCRHSNDSQQSWPSIRLMAEELCISESSVKRGLNKLARWNIISILRRKDPETKKNLPNIYTLLDKSEWKPKPQVSENLGAIGPEEQSQRSQAPEKETNKKETNIYIESIKTEFGLKINSGSRLTDKAKEKIKARLKTYTLTELFEAIDKFSRSEWWMEHNSGRGIEWFFRSDDQVDRFLNLKTEKVKETKFV